MSSHSNVVRGFASDNYAGICPEAMAALEEANQGHAVAYGEDPWTQRLTTLIQKIFECECSVYLTFNGTAANSLALAHLCGSYQGILCHEQSHLLVDECGAPSFFAGGARLIPVSGVNGKLNLEALEEKIKERTDIHSQLPRVVSLAQVTECGTVYTPDELRQIQGLCQKYGLYFHMDGARFANAVASLKLSPAELSWKVGVNVLSLGFTKNGVPMGDLVIFFDSKLAKGFEFRCKQGGQLASKSRFLAAPMVGLLENGAWLRNAAHANSMAMALESQLTSISGLKIMHPRQANALFLDFSEEVAEKLHQKGWRFYSFGVSGYRLMTAWDHTQEDVDRFVRDLKSVFKG
ncbi:MAG: low specificity L-threonine aldolase [Verrucomicrobiota bacterium]